MNALHATSDGIKKKSSWLIWLIAATRKRLELPQVTLQFPVKQLSTPFLLKRVWYILYHLRVCVVEYQCKRQECLPGVWQETWTAALDERPPVCKAWHW